MTTPMSEGPTDNLGPSGVFTQTTDDPPPSEGDAPVASLNAAVVEHDPTDPGIDRSVPTSRVTILHLSNPGTVVVPDYDGGDAITYTGSVLVATNRASIETKPGHFVRTKPVNLENVPKVEIIPGVGTRVTFSDGESWVINTTVNEKNCRSCG